VIRIDGNESATGQVEATFRNSRRASTFGWMRVAIGLVLIGAFVASRSVPVALAGVIVLVGGISVLRSKVTADRAAVHVRQTFGWRHLEWSRVASLLVERSSPRVGTMHSVVIVRAEGRTLRPSALISDTREDAEATLRVLETFRGRLS
jgi:hypothetical protein